MKQYISRWLSLFLLPFVALFYCPQTALSAQTVTTMEIIHTPVKTITAGRRTVLEVKVQDKAGVDLVRIYFKVREGAEYNFVVLLSMGDDSYSTILPAPANNAGTIQYLILAKNGDGQVFKSQIYRARVEDDESADEAIGDNEKIQVYSELNQAPETITGFSDNLGIDIVESSARFGITAMLYKSSGSASGGSSATTVSATSGGISTTTVVAGGAALAAIAAGVALSSSSGEDDGGSNGNTEETTTRAVCSFEGGWTGSWAETSCDTYDYSGSWTGAVNSNCYFSAQVSDGSGFMSGQINPATGIGSLNGNEEGCGPISGSATFRGNIMEGTFSGSGTTGHFSGAKNQ